MVRSREEDPQIGERIRDLRREAGITQAVLAERSELSLDAVNRIETNQRSPNVSTLYALARGLGLSPAELLEPGRRSGVVFKPSVTKLARYLEHQPDAVVAAAEGCAREIAKAFSQAG